MSGPTSREVAIDRFGTPEAADKYARSLAGSRTHRREMRCIRRALAGAAPGGRLLDLPCGAGRLVPDLLALGYHVTGVDSSPHMVGHARALLEGGSRDRAAFAVGDAFRIPCPDGAFDAVVCNRLLHHLREETARRRALAELARVSRGPVVVSFFCSLGFDGLVFRVKNALRSEKATDRIPISRAAFRRDVAAAGLVAERLLPTRPGISKQWYVRLSRPGRRT